MPSTITRARRNRSSRRKNNPANLPQDVTPIIIIDVNTTGSVLTLVFDQPVSLNGTPKFKPDVAGADPVSAVQTAPNTVAITYDTALTGATGMNIGYRDPAIRNSSGGYVTSMEVPL